MKIEKVLAFSEEDVKALVHIRAHIFHPMCEILENHCELCPFNGKCTDLEEFFDVAITKKQWFVPERNA